MKKLTLLVLLFSLFCGGKLKAQPPGGGGPYAPSVPLFDFEREKALPPFSECFVVNVNVPNQFPQLLAMNVLDGDVDPYSHVINKDCPPSQPWTVEIISNGECTSGYGLGYAYQNLVVVEFGGQQLANFSPPGLAQSVQFSGLFGDLDLSDLETPATYDFEVIHVSIFNGQISSTVLATVPILVLSNGQTFAVQEDVGPGSVIICNENNLPEELNQWGVCNEGNAQGTLSWTVNSASTSNSKLVTNVSISLSGSAGGTNATKTLTHNLSGSAGISYTYSLEEIETNSNQGSVSIPLTYDPNGCVHPGIDYQGWERETSIRMVNCNSLITVGTPITTFEVTRIALHRCVGYENESTGCAPAPHEVIQTGNFAGNTPARSASMDDCTFDVTVVQDPDAEYLELYYWTGPDGFEAVGPTIQGVGIGIYTVEITSECGSVEFIDVVVCPNPSNGPWQYNEDNDQYCRTVECDAGNCGYFETDECFIPVYTDWEYNDLTEEFCRLITCPIEGGCAGFDPTTECVDATFGDWTFNPDTKLCERDILLDGEPSGLIDTDEPLIEFDYNEFWEVCEKIYTCTGDVYTLEEDPTYGEWGYDDFWERCYREVICFGDQTDDDWEDYNEDPDIEWEHVEFWDECVGLVYCDDEGWGEDVELEGEVVYEWDYDDVYSECDALIYCEYNFEQHLIGETTEDEEVISWEIIQEFDGYYCDVTISCGDGALIEVIGTGIQTFDSWYDFEQNEWMCEIGCANDEGEGESLTVPCPGLVGGNGTTSLQFTPDQWEQILAYNRERRAGKVVIGPNPFTDQITLQHLDLLATQELQLQLVDTNGRVVKARALGSNPHSAMLTTSELPGGVYLIYLLDENGQLVHQQKVIKMR